MDCRRYRVVVEGELSDSAGAAFEGMVLQTDEGRTIMTGELRDQAELQGLLQRISDLGLTLVSAGAVDEDRERNGG